jgi:hypothetical protein
MHIYSLSSAMYFTAHMGYFMGHCGYSVPFDTCVKRCSTFTVPQAHFLPKKVMMLPCPGLPAFFVPALLLPFED